MIQAAHDLEKALRGLQPLLAERFRVRRLGYFGSCATGQQHADSDVDVKLFRKSEKLAETSC